MTDYPEIPDDFGHWLAGFLDGEGSFLIVKHMGGRRYRRTVGYACMCRVALRDDDRWGLEEIALITGLGKVRVHTNRPNRRSPGTNPSVQWSVEVKGQLLRLVELLDRYPLRMKKARDYAIWREAVVLWVAMRRLRPPQRQDWTAIASLQEKLRETRAYAPQRIVRPEPPPLLPSLF